MRYLKRILDCCIAAALLFSLCACGAQKKTTDVAFVTDIGDIYDNSFNGAIWEGVSVYASANGISAQYYRPAERSTDAYYKAIKEAISDGAETVVCHGDSFTAPVLKAAGRYDDVNFILTESKEDDLPSNVTVINFSSLEAGFLAGYAVVAEGFTGLAFQGGDQSDETVNYCFGFIQGAECAADDMMLDVMSIEMKINFKSDEETDDDVEARALRWYTSGLQVIFACGNGVLMPVTKVSEMAGNRWVIAPDVDWFSTSETVITCAEKAFAGSVCSALESIRSGVFAGGRAVTLGIADDGVLLNMNKSGFQTFKSPNYEALLAAVKNNPDFSASLVSAEDARTIILADADDIAALVSAEHLLIFTN
ncbi:MAG: BMP family protein [Acutalibacteraceae bacterium]